MLLEMYLVMRQEGYMCILIKEFFDTSERLSPLDNGHSKTQETDYLVPVLLAVWLGEVT